MKNILSTKLAISTLLAILTGLTPEVSADIGSLNPLNIFRRTKKFENLTPTPEEQSLSIAIYQEGKADLQSGKKASAARMFRKITKDFPHTDVAPNAFSRLGEIYRDTRKWEKSFKTFQEIIDRYPDYEGFEETVARQFEIAEALMKGARGRFLRIFPGFKNYDKAQEFMEQVYTNAPYGKTAPLALMNLARIAQQQDDEDAAIDALDRLVNNHAESILAPDAHLKLAGIYASLVKGDMYDQGSTLEAINYYEDFLILYPESHLVGEAEKALVRMREINAQSKLKTADFYFTYRKNQRAAINFYNETITVAPDSDAAKIAKDKIDAINRGERPDGSQRRPFGH
jgi:outer membrane protein assembly factor BamD